MDLGAAPAEPECEREDQIHPSMHTDWVAGRRGIGVCRIFHGLEMQVAPVLAIDYCTALEVMGPGPS